MYLDYANDWVYHGFDVFKRIIHHLITNQIERTHLLFFLDHLFMFIGNFMIFMLRYHLVSRLCLSSCILKFSLLSKQHFETSDDTQHQEVMSQKSRGTIKIFHEHEEMLKNHISFWMSLMIQNQSSWYWCSLNIRLLSKQHNETSKDIHHWGWWYARSWGTINMFIQHDETLMFFF